MTLPDRPKLSFSRKPITFSIRNYKADWKSEYIADIYQKYLVIK